MSYCVLSVLFPSCVPVLLPRLIPLTPVSHQPHQHRPVPGVSPPAPHPLVSLVCIQAVPSLFAGLFVLDQASPVSVPQSLCVFLICSGGFLAHS